ncbi:Ltp family lipoprotein [Enterococcus faecium]|uniref:Ltp family lipoprotein n=1 Tax=Enterococcus faecium TaxID=1352 RepID=UPI003CC68925
MTSDSFTTASSSNLSFEDTNALAKAYQYSKVMHMSKAAIYDQLTSEYGEKFSAEAAQYAIDNMIADFNANALAKAKEYQESMSMSPEEIREQLTSEYGEKFTPEEADYAIQHLND